MNPASFAPPSRAFWRKFRHLVMVTPRGAIRLTEPGRTRFGATFAAHGLAFDGAVDKSAFERLADAPLQPSIGPTREMLMARLQGARMSQYERCLLAEVLGASLPDGQRFAAPVVELDEWRMNRAA